MKKRSNAIQLAKFSVGCGVVFCGNALWPSSVLGQTPWQSAPATPATWTRPGGPPPDVVSLPPPPTVAPTDAAASLSVEGLTEGLSELFPPIPNPPTQAPQYQTPTLPPLPNLSQPSFPNLGSQAAAPNLPIPNAMATPAANYQLSPTQNNQPPSQLVSFESEAQVAPVLGEFPAGQLIAVVGTEHILAGDMAVFVEPIIEQNRARITSEAEEQKIRSQLTRQALRQYVEIKALFQEFFRDMLGTPSPKELKETKEKVTTKAGKIFFEKQVPVLFKKYKVDSIPALEAKLQEKSLSLSTLRTQFVEQVLSSELEHKHVPDKFEIDRYDLLTAYQEGKTTGQWSVPGRVRWRQLTVRFDKHEDRQAAEALIREMGNQVFLGGKPFEAVARQMSEGYTATEGGAYDWTTEGSLKSKELDQAIFSLPPRQLSQVIVDEIGLHIVEVLEREVGHVKDFTEAQAALRETLSNERRNKEIRKFRDRIMARTTVWTLWPEDIPGSRPLDQAL